ncbi:MAG: hypothetical protein KIH01_09155, partial [Candidatus Freyarchaeota archaeon]|nr:hypothetical protein [Candidatus Jordarchaeia archaeon]
MAVKTKLFMAALTLVLLATPFLARVVAAQSGDTDVFGADDLPLGLQLTETLHTIINEHKLAIIENAILEFKLKHDMLIENKTELIRSLINERVNRTLQIKEAIRELSTLYVAGNITLEEYMAGLSEL